ncbi:hypothetical protein BDR22DRAFT_344218 [Usnea florida]
MRYRIIVLLAVCSNIAAAGPLRHNGTRMQHTNVARFLNHTETPSVPDDIQTLTPIPTSSTPVIPSIAARPETSSTASSSSMVPVAMPLTHSDASSSKSAASTLTASMLGQGQATSITSATSPISSATAALQPSAVSSETYPVTTSALIADESEATAVQPAETMSRLFNIDGSPTNDLQSSTTAPSFSSTLSLTPTLSTSIMSGVGPTFNTAEVMATSSSSFAGYHLSSPSSEGASPISSSAALGQISYPSTTRAPTSSSAASSQTSQVVIPVPISSGVVQVLGAGGDTMDEFAPVTLDSSAPAPTATAKYPTAEGGNIAMANGFNNVYAKLNESSSCNPSDPNEAYACISGEIAECQADETYVLKSCPRFQSCYALPKPLGSTGVVVQCADPSYAASVRAGLLLSTAAPAAVSSQPTQLLQAEGDISQATQSESMQNPTQPAPSSSSAQATIQSQTVVTTPSVIASTASGSRDQGSDQVDQSATSTSGFSISAQSASPSQAQAPDPSVLAGTSTAQQLHDSSSFNISPKSETTSQLPSTTEPVFSVPNALFAVVTATENGQASPSQSSAQASAPTSQASQPQQTFSTPVSLQPTSSIDDGSTTFASTGVPVNEKVAVPNDQATVTVTVTVTTTENWRSAHIYDTLSMHIYLGMTLMLATR